MPVFIKDHIRILYVHTPKTGGTSIEKFFADNGFHVAMLDRGGANSLLTVLKCPPQHMHAAMLSDLLHMGGFAYRFMTVRHPIARIVSEYVMRAAEQPWIEPFDGWVAHILRAYEADNLVLDNHIRPQSDFLLPGCEVFRLEDGLGPAWVDTLAERTLCEFTHRRVGREMRFGASRPPVPDHATRQRLAAFYARDFAQFGYDPAADT